MSALRHGREQQRGFSKDVASEFTLVDLVDAAEACMELDLTGIEQMLGREFEKTATPVGGKA